MLLLLAKFKAPASPGQDRESIIAETKVLSTGPSPLSFVHLINASSHCQSRTAVGADVVDEVDEVNVASKDPLSGHPTAIRLFFCPCQAALAGKKSEVDALQGMMDTCVHSAFYQLATEVRRRCFGGNGASNG